MSLRAISAATLLAAMTACSGNGEMTGTIYEKPQVLPAINPICFTGMHVVVGNTVNQPIQLQNNGKQTLEISSVTIIEDARSHFTVQGPDITSVPELDFALLQLRYAPRAEGWDAAAVRIMSNAENYPVLDIYTVALAEPEGIDGGTWDPGPRPERARDACQE